MRILVERLASIPRVKEPTVVVRDVQALTYAATSPLSHAGQEAVTWISADSDSLRVPLFPYQVSAMSPDTLLAAGLQMGLRLQESISTLEQGFAGTISALTLFIGRQAEDPSSVYPPQVWLGATAQTDLKRR